MNKINRNAPCPCGSGKKYKKCCSNKTPLQMRSFKALTPDRVKKLNAIAQKISTPTPKDQQDS